jgi:hypothetical protein
MRGHRRNPSLLPLIALLSLGWAGVASGVEAPLVGVAGRVLGSDLGPASPLPSAGVYAFQLADSSLRKSLTDAKGAFHFPDLPAGLYKIIAFKKGFVPVVVLLTRTTAQAYQYVDVQLAKTRLAEAPKGDDFWSLRSRVPADVLHQIEADEMARFATSPATNGSRITNASLASAGFEADIRALTGVGDVASIGASQLTGGGVGLRGQVGDVQVGLKGQFLQLSGSSVAGSANLGSGRSSSLLLDLSHGSRNRVTVTSFNNSLSPRSDSGDLPIDFEHYQVNWSQEVGQNGRSEVSARYTVESNFHRQGMFEPWDVPDFSRTWRVEGAYTLDLSDRNSIQAGLRYREREFGLSHPLRAGKAFETQAISSVDLYSRGGIGIGPAVVVEYGMFSTLSDGTVSLAPQAGLVLQLGPSWQLHGSASQRLYNEDPLRPDFLPTLFNQSELCEQGSASCYELKLARKSGDNDELSVAALRRVVGNTPRLYFSEDFLDRDQSLYLVRGDELPELRVGFQKHLSPQVITKVDSSIASGGGGEFANTRGRMYENQVRYLTASVDTQLLASSTGIFLAFRRLQQDLEPVNKSRLLPSSETQYDRLQVVLSQSLSSLIDLASDWVLQLNMELARNNSNSPDTANDDRLHRRILGGIAVKF